MVDLVGPAIAPEIRLDGLLVQTALHAQLMPLDRSPGRRALVDNVLAAAADRIPHPKHALQLVHAAREPAGLGVELRARGWEAVQRGALGAVVGTSTGPCIHRPCRSEARDGSSVLWAELVDFARVAAVRGDVVFVKVVEVVFFAVGGVEAGEDKVVDFLVFLKGKIFFLRSFVGEASGQVAVELFEGVFNAQAGARVDCLFELELGLGDLLDDVCDHDVLGGHFCGLVFL